MTEFADGRFKLAVEELKDLRAKLAAGRMTVPEMETALNELMFEYDGSYWTLGAESGKWYVHDGQSWQRAEPPMKRSVVTPGTGSSAGGDGYTVTLVSAGEKKMAVIKEVRGITGLGLRGATDLVEGTPKTVIQNLSPADGEEIRTRLERLGAKVVLSRKAPV